MTLKQGAIVIAEDKFHHNDKSHRPHIILNNSSHPNYGVQYICMSVSTKQYERGIELTEDFFEYNNLYEKSYASPWTVLPIQEYEIKKTVAQLKPEAVEALETELFGYINPNRTVGTAEETKNTTSTQVSAD
jgi:hypothetical protein